MYLYPNLINEEKSSVYLLESPILWYARLGHLNYKFLKNLSNLGYISKLNLEEIRKCEICVEAMFVKISFHSIDRNTELLGLIHSDLCDLKFTPTSRARSAIRIRPMADRKPFGLQIMFIPFPRRYK